MKSVLDPLLAVTFLLFALPAMLFIGVAIRLTSRGPVIYRNRRLGRDG
jgi:lipopolysaccharide/colanic/teichoic acid biosynthesis glycosyltransferase